MSQTCSSCTLLIIHWEKSVITVTDLQSTPDFYPVSLHPKGFHYAVFSCSKLCVYVLSSLCFMETALKSPEEFSLASSCHVVSAGVWCGLGDVCTAQEAVTTLLFTLPCSSPAVWKHWGCTQPATVTAEGTTKLPVWNCSVNWTFILKNVVTHTSQRSSEIK